VLENQIPLLHFHKTLQKNIYTFQDEHLAYFKFILPLVLWVVALLQNLPHEHTTTAMSGLRDNETT